ncbi:MAG: hypothetical protein AAF907_08440, partial [Planctomycetota bacterium]
MRPRTYEFSHTAPNLSTLLERAGGLSGISSNAVRVIRGGRQVYAGRYQPGQQIPLAGGDVVICDAAPGVGPQQRGVSFVALVGLTNRPIVLKLKTGDANVPSLLKSLGLPPQSIHAVGVLLPRTGAAAGAGALPDGTVLAFGPGSVTPAQFNDFSTKPFNDLVPEEKPESVSLVGSFEPVRRNGAQDDPSNAPGRITPRRARVDDKEAQSEEPPASAAATPALTLLPAGPVTSLSAPPTAAAPGDPTFMTASDPTPLGVPIASPPAGVPQPGAVIPDGSQPTVTDVTSRYGPMGEDVAVLPAPSASPYYDAEATPGAGPNLADSGSHLTPLDDYLATPGLSAPIPGTPIPGGMPMPNGLDPRRVATAPGLPGRISDAVPRPLGRGIGGSPAAPAPISGRRAKPITSAPATPKSAPARSDADDTDAAADAAGGFPWLPAGIGLGALLGGGIAASIVRSRKRQTALDAVGQFSSPLIDAAPAATAIPGAATGAARPALWKQGPAADGPAITADEARVILEEAFTVMSRARAQIRRPLDSPAEVSISLVDTRGRILGIVRAPDAPIFGTDVSLQKARTATFFSNAIAADELLA